MNERRRPPRRGRGQRPHERPAAESTGEPNPYRDEPIDSSNVDAPVPSTRGDEDTPQPRATTTIENDRPPRHVEPDVAPDLPPPVTAQRDDDAPVRSAAEEGDTREEAPRPETFQPRLQNGSAENAGQGVTMANGTTPQQSSSSYTPNAPRHEGSYPPREHRNGRRRRRGRDRGPRRDHQQQPPAPVSLAPSRNASRRESGMLRTRMFCEAVVRSVPSPN